MKLFASDAKGIQFAIDNLSGSTKIKELKQRIIREKNINDEIIIIIDGEPLGDNDEDKELDDYGLNDQDYILYIRKYPAGLYQYKDNFII
jgi:hypothetical protein